MRGGALRIVLVGGTRFVGRAIVEELVAHGHEVSVAHRGVHEPDGLPAVSHFHGDRGDATFLAQAFAEVRPDAVVDTCAMTATDADRLLDALPQDVRLLALSSMDVYRAWHSVRNGLATDGVPLTEDAPLRTGRYLYRGEDADQDDYEKLDVEERYARRAATICRLPMIYGDHDHSRREGFVLDRVAARRARIPIGSGGWLWSRGHVQDLASGVRLALESDRAVGETFNLCETTTAPMRTWVETILAAAGAEAELVRAPDRLLPRDLWVTASIAQPMLADCSKATSLLGWAPRPSVDTVSASVAWHLAQPAPERATDFPLDDAALQAADRSSTA